MYWAHLSRFHLETLSYFRNVLFYIYDRMGNTQNCDRERKFHNSADQRWTCRRGDRPRVGAEAIGRVEVRGGSPCGGEAVS
jgi:hypothetical protein